MKKLAILFTFCLAVSSVFSQTDPIQLKNEGSNAFNAKNYAEAYTKYSQYLTQTNDQDSVTAYFCGMSAASLKKYPEAVKYFDIAIQKNYNVGNAYARKALVYAAQNDTKNYLTTLDEGLKAAPDNVTLQKRYGIYYLKAGITDQKAGKYEEAKDNYKKVTALSDQKMKSDALYSLGVLCYNNGARTLKNASPLANTDATKYATEKASADADFKDAKDYLTQASQIDPANANVKTMLKQVEGAMK
ncbi:MAG: hypothetical protein WCR45_10105 [Bacteroidaceae bacterium]